MRILMVHNSYQQRGGEDESTAQDIQLLREHGHDVKFHSRHNDEIDRYSFLKKGSLLFSTTWSGQAYREICDQIQQFHPDLIHVQNFFPLISPSIYDAARKFHIPVVQTLHNYRLMCCNGLFLREGKVCELCMNRFPVAGIRYRCYRNSMAQSLAVALMIGYHRLRLTWQHKVDQFIVLGKFTRNKFIEGGIPANKISVRPNFLADMPGNEVFQRERFALFVGRLSLEKGIPTLLEAWKTIPDLPLVLVGDGPLREWAEEFIQQEGLTNVALVGRVDQNGVFDYLRRAEMLIVPSEWYETFGRVVIEAFAAGTPVIVSRIGALQDLVIHGETGLLFKPGDNQDLVDRVRQLAIDSTLRESLLKNAYQVYRNKYSAERAYTLIMEIYSKAMTSSNSEQP